MADIDKLRICNEALISLGETALDDLESDGVANTVARLKYQPVVDAILGSHPWSFNRVVVPLARLAVLPAVASQFTGAYQIPADAFRVVVPWINGRREDEWNIAAGLLLIDAGVNDAVSLEYHARVDESLWPPGFHQAVVMQLAAEFAIPITDDTARAKLLFEVAAVEQRRARYQNAYERPSLRLQTGRLAALRGR